MSFGPMPIANGFLAPQDIPLDTYRFELATASCKRCRTFQLIDQPPPDKMFHANYAFFSQTSRVMQDHFENFALDIAQRLLARRDDPFVVELGSNDGIMLRHIAKRGVRHLGVEPSANVAAAARNNGVNTTSVFFDAESAANIREQYGPADVIAAANVMCHIGSIRDVAAGIALLLRDDGVLIFEDPYLGEVIAKTSYDQIYDEHVFLFSLESVRAIFGPHGLSVIDVAPQTTHGGSMRYTLGKTEHHEVSSTVTELEVAESRQGLGDDQTYDRFRQSCEASKAALNRLLGELRGAGKRIAGYGATSKSTTVLNYCGIGPELIEFISDTTPIKQGKVTPGTHISVKPPSCFSEPYPDFAVLFAWNHAAEIIAKEKAFLESGGRFITFVPEVGMIQA
ncbi:MAG: methyltransferase domain-containing protein [Rhodobacteraceae bacterium]|nr:methyltransferase domain-containing protein [Paracoccaceae bacterium]